MKIQFLRTVATLICTLNIAKANEQLLYRSMKEVSKTFESRVGLNVRLQNEVFFLTDKDYCRDFSSSFFSNAKCKMQMRPSERYSIDHKTSSELATEEQVTCYQSQAKELFRALIGLNLKPVADGKKSFYLYLHTFSPYQGNSDKFLSNIFNSENIENEIKKYHSSPFFEYCRFSKEYCVEATYSLVSKECKIQTAEEIIERTTRLIQETEDQGVEEETR
jgi:hypothetical protein